MKNEIKVIHENIFLDQVEPNHYRGYKVEIKEYVGRIAKKSVIVDIGWVKPVRIAIKNLLDDGCWYYGEGFSTKCYKISNEDLEYLRKINKINNNIMEIKKEFNK